VFWVNVPIGIVAAITASMVLPAATATGTGRLHLPAVLLASLGLTLVLYPLIAASGHTQWPSWTYPVLAAGLLVLAAFCLQQRHEIARGRQPLLDLRLLTRRSLASGLVVQFLFLVPIMGFFLTFMQFLQRGLGMSPLQAGMTMLPWSITVTVFAALSAAVLLPKIGRIAVQLGLVLTAVGLTVISLTATGADGQTGTLALLPGILIGAAGMGLVVAPIAQLTLTDVTATEVGTGSGLFNTISQLGASIGIATMGTLFFNELRLDTPATEAAQAYGHAFSYTPWISVALLVIALAASYLLPTRLPPRQPTPPEWRSPAPTPWHASGTLRRTDRPGGPHSSAAGWAQPPLAGSVPVVDGLAVSTD